MANTELLKQIAENGKKERTSGPTPERILRVQRIDIGKIDDFKDEIRQMVIDVMQEESEKTQGRLKKTITEFGQVLKQFQFNMQKEKVKPVGDAYTASNGTTRRTFDANDTTLNELSDLVATLIADLKRSGIIR